ncbi:MAG: 50S ribosomal protein L5 [Halobacteriales archaeon]
MSEVAEVEMREPRVEKVVVNMSIGRGGEDLEHAEEILASITGQTPVRTEATQTIPAFDIREGLPVGAKVTLRGERADAFLETIADLVALSPAQFDETGNVSFGIQEHTDFPGQEYDPTVGLYGMDVTINLVRPGYRIAKRERATRSIPHGHRLTPADAMAFLESRYGVTISDE